MQSIAPKLLILDLDETLVYATELPLDRPGDFEFDEYTVYKRPHVREFIEFCSLHFRLAVWTSSSESYARVIVSELFGNAYPLEFVWSRKRCTQKFNPEDYSYEWLKNLDKVRRRGYLLEQTLMIDDTPAKLQRHYGNLVRVREFEGDPADDELRRLMPYLLKLKDAENVRQLEKRNWRLTNA